MAGSNYISDLAAKDRDDGLFTVYRNIGVRADTPG